MPQWLLYPVFVLAALVAAVIVRAVLRARRRHVRRQVIDDRLDVPERTPIAERLAGRAPDEQAERQRLVACGSCGHQHPYTSGLRSGDLLLVDCPGCGRRSNHEFVA